MYDLAREQHQVVHVRQVAALGVDPRVFRAHVQSNGGTRLQRGAWLLPGAEQSFDAEATAALLAAGDRVALTGRSALWAHGVLDRAPPALQVAVPADRARPALSGVDDVVRTSTLLRRDVVDVAGHRALVVAWSLLHAGRRDPSEQVLEWKITADQRGKLLPGEVEDVLNRSGTATGKRSLRLAYEATVTDIVDSVLELDARRFVRGLGYVPYPSPFPFLCPDRRVIHLDLPFPTYWFAYECDSPQSRGGGRAFRTDRKRWREAQKGGWRISWLTRDQLINDRDSIVEELADVVAKADLDRPPPVPTPCRQRRCSVCADLRGT
jgi:hypothetical protein